MVKDAVVFTTTFYNNSPEGIMRKNLAIGFAQRVVEQDYPLVVLDGGTDDGRFIDQLKSIGVYAFPETAKGLAPSRREALGYADKFAVENNISILDWCEPEKVDHVHSIDYLVKRMKESGADLIVPHRISMRSYPESQEFSERFGNHLHTNNGYVDIHGMPLDQFNGPHMWKRQMTPYFKVFDDPKVAEVLAEMRITDTENLKPYGIKLDDNGKAVELKKAQIDIARGDHMMHMPTSLMILRGQKVLSVHVDYTHPAEQTEIETKNQALWDNKRLWQLGALAEQFRLVRVLYERGVLEERLVEELKAAA